MQEITAIMLETVRKGFWKASPEQIKSLTDLHLDLVERFGLEPSGFAGENDKLQDFIERSVPKEQAATYRSKIQQVKAAKGSDNIKDSKVLRKEESSGQKEKVNLNGLWIGVGVVAVFVALVIVLRRKRRR